jgi:formylglycine-generating enzyme required for sulfatase activity
MKYLVAFSVYLTCFVLETPAQASSDPPASPIIIETQNEFFGSGDFDGDGQTDLVIVDKPSGKFRIGYQISPNRYMWVDCRPSGLDKLAGFTIGKLLSSTNDSLAFSSPDANQVTLVNAASRTAPSKPVTLPFSAGLGPSVMAAVPPGPEGRAGFNDLFVGSMYNSPEPGAGAVLRNDGSTYPVRGQDELVGLPARPNRVELQAGHSAVMALQLAGDKGDKLQIEDTGSGKLVTMAEVDGLPTGSEYAMGNFASAAFPDFLIYHPGDSKLTDRKLEEGDKKLTFSPASSYDLGHPIKRVLVVNNDNAARRLLVIFGEGQEMGVFTFDGKSAPVLGQTILATNELFTAAAGVPGGMIIFASGTRDKFSVRYRVFTAQGGTLAAGIFGSLPTLADNDNITVPDIYARILKTSPLMEEKAMRIFTNTIPGTQVTYVMVPIPGGEFLMGSPDTEAGRKPDEGPQHKVAISPFWMGQYEVTWNEYELFMYPDEEKKIRASMESDPAANKLADAVTHPSKPYVEMSFGMGKDGYPAISMTQHAANKYCQWLSAKTGQFYRLPTEAEWEYACRAGTTTTYFFGDDASKLGEYAWFEQNSDFKYQKVGRKKPNPWGLYDIYGNVVEWTLDQFDPDIYKKSPPGTVLVDPWNKASLPYPHSVKGGSWDDDAAMCRSAARRGSDRSWKMTDPQLPKSVWYHSDAQWVGFRIVRPLKVPKPEDMQKYWTSGVERD